MAVVPRPSGVNPTRGGDVLPFHIRIIPVPGHTRLVPNDSLFFPSDSIKQSGFPDIRSAHNGKVAIAHKEMKSSDAVFGRKFTSTQEETTLHLPLPPGRGREVIFGFTLSKGKVESVTFEVQINPPEGGRKRSPGKCVEG